MRNSIPHSSPFFILGDSEKRYAFPYACRCYALLNKTIDLLSFYILKNQRGNVTLQKQPYHEKYIE